MSSLPPFVYLFLTLAAAIIAIGGFIWLFGYINNKKDQEDEQPPALEPESKTLASVGEQELLRVSRTEKGELVIFVQGHRRRRLQEITDPQTGRETIEAIKAVMTFSKDWLPSIRQQAAPSTSPPETSIDQETFLKQLRQAPPPLSEKPPGLLAPLQRQTPGNLLDPLHLVDEIDELVQQRLQAQPDLAGRHVRLASGLVGGLCVYVDQQVFEAVGDISDPQIRTLIQDAIHEWEGR
ncbi:MAG: hypothetical protein KKC18_01785 [Chloroflexi bacterium]|nr:hypothetical protein [Chloroflexota bacterium]